MIGNISDSSKALLRSTAFALALHLTLANAQTGQAPKTTPAESTSNTSFEVVSIKPSNQPPDGNSSGVVGDTYRATNLELFRIIGQAYIPKTNANLAERIKGGPQGILNERYDIVAKLDEPTARRIDSLHFLEQMDAVAPMLRTMLEERFHLKVTPTTVQARAYALVPGKHGPRLELAPENGSFPPEIEKQIAANPLFMKKMPNGGQVSRQFPGETPRPLFFQMTMDELVAYLGQTGRIIVNRTGLTGRYNFYLPRVMVDPGTGDAEDRLYSWQWSKIGLEIKPVTVTVPAIEVEHVERATAN